MTGVPCCTLKLWLTATCKTHQDFKPQLRLYSTDNPWTMTMTALAVLGDDSLGQYDAPCDVAQR
eukprot:3940306-Rhodomonas_salina.2